MLRVKSLRKTHAMKGIILLAVALLAAGCTGWAEGPGWGGRGAIAGRVSAHVGGYSLPLMGARVVLSQSQSGSTTTNRNGRYTYTGLLEGRHNVTLQALHGKYEETVHIRPDERRQPQNLDWNVRPRHLDSELFFYLSGLKSLYINDWGGLQTYYGELVRWEKPVVRVYFDVDGAPPGFDPRWVDAYWREPDRWRNYLRQRIGFTRVWAPHSADIVVTWVPKGWLGDHAGVARHVAFYENGALKRVEIEIDVAYGDYPGLWEHEFAHAMGVDHIDDEKSVMYPYLLDAQRTTLSSREVDHVRLMYDIPSGATLGRGGGYGSFATDGVGLDGEPLEVEITPVTGRREHVLRLPPEF